MRPISIALDAFLRNAYRRAFSPPPNLEGDRDIEHSFVAAHIPAGPGTALDFGCGSSHLGLVAARKGYKVTAVDLRPVTWRYTHAHLEFVQGDVFGMELPDRCFDLILNCSSVEHVGLTGRYGVQNSRDEGDLEAMSMLKRITKPAGMMLLTVPVGRDGRFVPLHRVYGPERLPRLLEQWHVEEEEFWAKRANHCWVSVDRALALAEKASDHYYALGLFVLKRPADD